MRHTFIHYEKTGNTSRIVVSETNLTRNELWDIMVSAAPQLRYTVGDILSITGSSLLRIETDTYIYEITRQ